MPQLSDILFNVTFNMTGEVCNTHQFRVVHIPLKRGKVVYRQFESLATIQSRHWLNVSRLAATGNATNVIDFYEKAMLSGTTLMHRRCS